MGGKKKTGHINPQTSGQPEIENSVRQYTRLAGGIAHDLNTILTTIYGYSELALESLDETSEAGQSIRRIIRAADRAKILSRRLMNLSLHTASEKEKIRVKNIISETVSFIKPSIPGKTEVIENIAAPDILVSADPVQLLRAFVNLSVNALQAMEETGGRLTITLEAIRKEGTMQIPATEYALIRFADTGIGMKEKTAEKMFDPFFTTGKKGKGTGIGLTLVRDIISDLNGDIKVSSRVNEGTVIEVLIPAVTGKAHKLTD